VIVYMVIGLPPFAGGDQVTVADSLPAVAVTFPGAAGAVGAVGVTWPDGAEAGPVPTPLVAVTVKVYEAPSVRPLIEALVAGGVPVTTVGVWAAVPMYGVTVYDVIGLPPFAGAVQDTTAELLPAVAMTAVGAAGAVGGARLPALKTTVAISQIVLAPVPALAAGVAPAPTTWSSVRISISSVSEILVLAVYPDPAVRVSPKPESE
jgi:hypothetical protein